MRDSTAWCKHMIMHSSTGRLLLPAQATFFLALSVAARLGTAALAAHQVVAQLWLLTSYVVDGFAVAATVLGSRLVAKADPVAHRCTQPPDCLKFLPEIA